MSTTKLCPKCSATLDSQAPNCSECNHLFKDICQQCQGAYPIAKLRLINNLFCCEDCLQKQTTFIEQGRFVPEISSKKTKAKSNSIAWIWALLPLIGPIKYLRLPSSIKQTYKTSLTLSLLWTLLCFYFGLEAYFFFYHQNPSKKICLLIQEIQQSQESCKKKKNSYGMLEQLIEQQHLSWKIEITARQVVAEKEGYRFYIYLASRDHWKLKATPIQLQSFSLRFYSDQSGQIRFSYKGEADESSPLWVPESITFFHYLLKESLLSQFIHRYL